MLAELGVMAIGGILGHYFCPEVDLSKKSKRKDREESRRRHCDDGYHDRRKQESFNSRMYDELYG